MDRVAAGSLTPANGTATGIKVRSAGRDPCSGFTKIENEVPPSVSTARPVGHSPRKGKGGQPRPFDAADLCTAALEAGCSDKALRVFIALNSYAFGGRDTVWPGTDALLARGRMSKSTLLRGRRELRQLGLIRERPYERRSITYEIVVKPSVRVSAQTPGGVSTDTLGVSAQTPQRIKEEQLQRIPPWDSSVAGENTSELDPAPPGEEPGVPAPDDYPGEPAPAGFAERVRKAAEARRHTDTATDPLIVELEAEAEAETVTGRKESLKTVDAMSNKQIELSKGGRKLGWNEEEAERQARGERQRAELAARANGQAA